MKRILITGASGFVGSHLVEEILKTTDWEIVAMVRLSTIGDMHRLTTQDVMGKEANRVKVVYHDLKNAINEAMDARIGHIDYVAHLAANSHVDRSITHPKEFFEDNVMGTVNLLEWARKRQQSGKIEYGHIEKFINFGTDEVFGPAPDNYDYKEDDSHNPSNPYSASKAGQLDAGYSYWITYKLPIITTHTMNIFGERQNAEKLVPKCIRYINEGKVIPIHASLDERGAVLEVGKRHWLHARNAANAVVFLLQKGVIGQRYNIVGDIELDNAQVATTIGKILGKEPKLEFVDFHKTRPGHDRRYALDGSKIKELGWIPPVDFEESMKKMIDWTLKHPEWL